MWALFVVYGVFYGLTEPVEKALVSDLVRAGSEAARTGRTTSSSASRRSPPGLLTGACGALGARRRALEAGAALAGAACFALLGWDRWRARWAREAKARARADAEQPAPRAEPS